MDYLSKLALKEIELFEQTLNISDKTTIKKIPKKNIIKLKNELNQEIWNKKAPFGGKLIVAMAKHWVAPIW